MRLERTGPTARATRAERRRGRGDARGGNLRGRFVVREGRERGTSGTSAARSRVWFPWNGVRRCHDRRVPKLAVDRITARGGRGRFGGRDATETVRASAGQHRRGSTTDDRFTHLRSGTVTGVTLRAGTRAGRPRDGHRGGGGGERHHLAETDERVATSAEVMSDPRCVRGSEAFDGGGRT